MTKNTKKKLAMEEVTLIYNLTNCIIYYIKLFRKVFKILLCVINSQVSAQAPQQIQFRCACCGRHFGRTKNMLR